jgi:multidrug efflux pump subunit AcrB
MGVHDPLKRLVLKGASLVSGMEVLALRQWPVSIIAITVVTLSLSMILTICINKYFPWMIKGISLSALLRRRG